MIPASYLFKDIYHQHWDEPDAPIIIERPRRFGEGLLRPLASATTTLFHRPSRTYSHHTASHA